jgi:hypothetical protein
LEAIKCLNLLKNNFPWMRNGLAIHGGSFV